MSVVVPASVDEASRPRARRHDLDGLRAVAVLLVAVYHVWVHRVSGGVDVFLLLSGFFVGGSLVRGIVGARPVRLRTYFPRLARRLLPALIVVVGACIVLGYVLLAPNRWSENARQSIASLLAVENWYLALSGRDYGAADVVGSPFQHIWSLSVQSQLFVLLPMLLLAVFAVVRRMPGEVGRKVVVGVVVGLASASFVYACVGVLIDQPWAYYDTFARAWEYLAGTLAAIWLFSRHGERAQDRLRHRPLLVATAGWTGVALVLVAGVVTDGLRQYPGPAALVPVAGALLLIVFAGSAGAPSRLLGTRPVARAGRYAYAFYLWHWPVLVFAIAARGGADVGWLAGSLVLVVSAGLAVATHYLVERPFTAERDRAAGTAPRGRPFPALVPIAAAMAVVVTVSAGWLVRAETERAALLGASGDLGTHPGAMAAAYPELFSYDPDDGLLPDLAVAADDKPRAVFDGCGNPTTVVEVCSYGDLDAERVVAVVGGSHTEQWIDALAMVGEEDGFRVDTMIKWTCELIDGVEGVEILRELNPECEPWSANALARLEADPPDAVFTTWTRPAPDDVPGLEMVPAAYVDAWDRLDDAGVVTIAIRDNPWTSSDTLDCIAANIDDLDACGVWAADHLDDEPPFPAGDPAWETSVRPLDVNDIICPQGWCPFVQGGRIVYRDDHHLSNSYAISMASVLRERMTPLLPWAAEG